MTYKLTVSYFTGPESIEEEAIEFEEFPVVQSLGHSILWTDMGTTSFGVPFDRLISWELEKRNEVV